VTDLYSNDFSRGFTVQKRLKSPLRLVRHLY